MRPVGALRGWRLLALEPFPGLTSICDHLYTRSNLTLSNLLLLLFPQPQAHQRIPGPSGPKSADYMGAAACVVEGADWGVGDEVGRVG